jgi:hypothetical protein
VRCEIKNNAGEKEFEFLTTRIKGTFERLKKKKLDSIL